MKFKNFVLKANIGIYDIDTTFSIHWVSLDDYSGTKRNAFSLDRERWALITAWDYETWIEQNSGKFDLFDLELSTGFNQFS